jgi:glycosyltransferase involved in cell wall biosynthesis
VATRFTLQDFLSMGSPRPGLVSVVIPSYNYGHFIADAVEGALAQDYAPVEVIVIDDGSTDGTHDRLAPYASRIRYVYQRNRGLSAARNTGVRLANGEWIALLDADDVWHRNKLRIQLTTPSSLDGVGLIGSPSVRSELSVEPLPSNPAVRDLSVRDFLLASPTGPSGTLVRRECFDAVGLFDETLTSIEDRDMWLRVAARYRTIQVGSPCWWYRPHQGQMSRKAGRMLDNYARVLTKFFREHPHYRSLETLARSYMYFDGSWCFMQEGDNSTARALMLKSVFLRPHSLGDPGLRPFIRARIAARLFLGERSFKWLSAAKGRA